MNNIDKVVSFIEKGDIASAHKFIKESNDESLLIYEAISLLAEGKLEDTLTFIKTNEKALLKHEPEKTIDLHVSIYIELEDFVKAMETLGHYEDLPYISQAVEETFKDLKEAIKEAQKIALEKKTKKFSLEEVKETLLTSIDSGKIVTALEEAIDKKRIKKTLPLIKEFLLRDLNEAGISFLKSYALGLLANIPVDEEIEVLTKIDGIQKVKPTKLVPPTDTKNGKKFIEIVENLSNNDVTIFKNASQIFNEYYISRIPLDVFKEDKLTDLAEAVIYVANKYMGREIDASKEILKIAEKIERVIR